MDYSREIIKWFHLYSGKESINENPIKRHDDFKWHMWHIECIFLQQYKEKRLTEYKTLDELKKYYDLYIRTYIKRYSREQMDKYYSLYKSYKKV